MMLAGLRVGEATNLRWRDLDLARGKLSVRESKTDTGVREVELSPDLLEDLKLHRANAGDPSADDLVFGTSRGTPLHRANVSNGVLSGAIGRANKKRKDVLYEAGASSAYVMSQMGHTSSALALEVYAKKMERSRDTGARMDELIRGADWAPLGTNGAEPENPLASQQTKTPPQRGISRLRG